jgi:hypothetical protein
MKNVIFISPNFPTNYWQFCRELKNNGMNVLGIGDAPYDELSFELKDSLNEYYKVGSLENYDEVYRAVAFFSYKYGKIDWLESNNEYWLEQDAQLRTDFNITTGFHVSDMPRIKFKSKMKKYYTKVNIPVARYHMVDTPKKCLEFVKEVGYPVVAKPDNGVGASHTFKIENDEQMTRFFEEKWPNTTYIMEEFINAEINSYDAIIDSHGNPMFEAGNVTPMSIMDIVNNADNSLFYIVKDLADDTRKLGRDTVKSFGVKSRFVHFEFFRLLSDHEGIGKKGDLMALEVNMRPSGGFTPDMINFARETDVYKIWADMIAFDKSTKPVGDHHFCAFAGLRDGKDFVLTPEDILEKYGEHIKMIERIPDALSGAMGNQMYLATFDTQKELDAFYADVTKCKKTVKGKKGKSGK